MKERLYFSEEEANARPIFKDNEYWIKETSLIVYRILQRDPAPLPKIPPLSLDHEWLASHYQILRMGSKSGPISLDRFHQRRRCSLLNLTQDISKGGDYELLVHLWQQGGEVFGKTAFDALDTDIATIYYLLCPPDRLLASVKRGPHWKPVDSRKYPLDEREMLWENICFDMLAPLQLLEPEDVDMIPDRFISGVKQNRIEIPRPVKSVEELLEEAYYGQRYIVPPEGAIVHLQKAGDLQSLTVKESGGCVIAKAKFNQGEAMGIIILDSASIISPCVHSGRKNPKFECFPRIIAEVYRDLVTAIEIPALRKRRSGTINPSVTPTDKEYTYVYIPRTIRVGGKEKQHDPRLPYEGPERPISPHKVTGHVRNVPMTEEHRRVLEEFERETGLRVLEFVPVGSTFVRPHVSPAITPELLDRLPQFIKRKIETELQESIKKQAAKNGPTVLYQSGSE